MLFRADEFRHGLSGRDRRRHDGGAGEVTVGMENKIAAGWTCFAGDNRRHNAGYRAW